MKEKTPWEEIRENISKFYINKVVSIMKIGVDKESAITLVKNPDLERLYWETISPLNK